jgi:hypothetical protein
LIRRKRKLSLLSHQPAASCQAHARELERCRHDKRGRERETRAGSTRGERERERESAASFFFSFAVSDGFLTSSRRKTHSPRKKRSLSSFCLTRSFFPPSPLPTLRVSLSKVSSGVRKRSRSRLAVSREPEEHETSESERRIQAAHSILVAPRFARRRRLPPPSLLSLNLFLLLLPPRKTPSASSSFAASLSPFSQPVPSSSSSS